MEEYIICAETEEEAWRMYGSDKTREGMMVVDLRTIEQKINLISNIKL